MIMGQIDFLRWYEMTMGRNNHIRYKMTMVQNDFLRWYKINIGRNSHIVYKMTIGQNYHGTNWPATFMFDIWFPEENNGLLVEINPRPTLTTGRL